jgi:hypothetical protein
VGTYDARPVINMNANASAPGGGTAGGILSQRYGGNYTGTINVLQPYLHSRYDSLQSTLKYRFHDGSNVRMSYTWSKAMDYAENEDLGGLSYPYPAFVQKNYGPAGFDRTNNFELSGTFALPFGKGEPWLQSGVGNAILGGWLINPVISAMSGIPFTVTANGTLNANGSGQTADLVGSYKVYKGRPLRTGQTCPTGNPSCAYFNANAFAAPYIPLDPKNNNAPINPHYGNTNRNEFRGPGYFLANLSILRDFKIKELMTFEIRADAIGLTNTPHFANPTVSCGGSAVIADPTTGSGQNCAAAANNNFGVITGTSSPGGFFGPDSGSRVLWLGAMLKF